MLRFNSLDSVKNRNWKSSYGLWDAQSYVYAILRFMGLQSLCNVAFRESALIGLCHFTSRGNAQSYVDLILHLVGIHSFTLM